MEGHYDDPEHPPTKKSKFHARIFNLPVSSEISKGTLPRACDIGRFVSVRGTVIRTGTVKMLESKRNYKCGMCQMEFEKEADLSSHDPFPPPTKCESNIIPACGSRKFTAMAPAEIACRDYQEIKIQEQMHVLGVGSIPRSISVIIMDDLVDIAKPGDDVTISGEVMRRWKPLYAEERCEVEIVILANHIRVNNEQKLGIGMSSEIDKDFQLFWKKYKKNKLAGRDMILKSICPEMYGMSIVKLAVALILIGGVQHTDENDGTKVRGESHMLMVGDPGTGKSQILKYAARLANRSVVTTGIGTTTAGLTVTAVKDKGGDWVLEAGALVLADGGVCCIDEFSSIQEHDKTSIHEAMEQQTLSVAKAGLICNLKTRCSVIAATNPKGKYDPDEDLTVNIAMAAPLLSRFDLVLVMMDEADLDWDRTVSNFILHGGQFKEQKSHKDLWPLEKIRSYISHVKTKFKPKLSSDAQLALTHYYKQQRIASSRSAARTTIRMLESLIRLAQAHARLMYRDEVLLQDAIVAISMVEASMSSSAISGDRKPVVRSQFPKDPEAYYKEEEEVILKAIGLSHLCYTEDDCEEDEVTETTCDERDEAQSQKFDALRSKVLNQIEKSKAEKDRDNITEEEEIRQNQKREKREKAARTKLLIQQKQREKKLSQASQNQSSQASQAQAQAREDEDRRKQQEDRRKQEAEQRRKQELEKRRQQEEIRRKREEEQRRQEEEQRRQEQELEKAEEEKRREEAIIARREKAARAKLLFQQRSQQSSQSSQVQQEGEERLEHQRQADQSFLSPSSISQPLITPTATPRASTKNEDFQVCQSQRQIASLSPPPIMRDNSNAGPLQGDIDGTETESESGQRREGTTQATGGTTTQGTSSQSLSFSQVMRDMNDQLWASPGLEYKQSEAEKRKREGEAETQNKIQKGREGDTPRTSTQETMIDDFDWFDEDEEEAKATTVVKRFF
eukprot:TRINITY_DN5123_c1_g1_i1.p1 TRINITY_DN5123_c1_g1~~TRINITY_DN5123_c1_g1_i1.p1  ORF type:complete len:1057 (-),score=254.83 TRINITY_DN5123_c1_g1_i1:27-2912(-)